MVQKRCFYEWSTRIPLIINFPDRRYGGQQVAAPVSLLDLPPTLLDLAGVPLVERLPMDRVLPEIKVELSDVADYRRLATFIEAHGFRTSQLWRRYVSPEEVLGDWYEYHYRPIAEMIREERVLGAFPDRTELDLYLWIVNHRERLALEARDEKISPRAAKDDILKNVPRRRRPPAPDGDR
jgi:hypothetical protein